jgi:hypothetical protein
MDYRAFYNMVMEEIEYLQVFDVTSDYRACKALAALYELQEYSANRIAELVNAGELEPDPED